MTLRDFIKKRKYLVWHTKNFDDLSEEVIVEAILNYGDWEDVKELFRILGLKKTAEIFWRQSRESAVGRQNYRPEVKNYFTLYFDKYA